MNKGKLNKSGLVKLIPYLEGLADEIYGEHGGLNLRIGYDGELRMLCRMPCWFQVGKLAVSVQSKVIPVLERHRRSPQPKALRGQRG